MHIYDESTDDLAEEIVSYALRRIRMDPPPLDKPRTPDQLRAEIGATITAEGIGGHEAFRRFVDHIAPSTISIDCSAEGGPWMSTTSTIGCTVP